MDRSGRELSNVDFEQGNEANRDALYEESPFAAELEVNPNPTERGAKAEFGSLCLG